MTGKYEIEVYNNRVHYFLTVKRNITILQGDSATGKTELIRLISDHEENGVSSGITIKCDSPCTVLTAVDWELRLDRLKKHIIFIDETAVFLKTQQFAEHVRASDNYFVIVTRDDLPQLPYSVDEIYGLRNVSDSAKYKSFKKVYNEMYRLYNLKNPDRIKPDLVITEDTNSGLECFRGIYGDICRAAGGKSKIYHRIRSEHAACILVIVDGAAFGAEIGKVYRYLKMSGKNCIIYAPESFEYLILKAGIIDVPASVTDETYKYADSVDYMSWEEFYTVYLVQAARDTVYRYSKSKLGEAYKTEGTIRRIKNILPEKIQMDR
ncbi:MAG: translation initiation factor 2 [Lachnospiraceae bacterium]|nr:translation initiation factor 2 [Lachnospiraceae bacterium]